MEYAYKFRIYPTRKQEEQILQTFGCCRYVYNYYLDVRKSQHERGEKSFNYNACINDLTQLKKALPWLRDVDSTALQNSLRDLDTAFQNFFRRVTQGKRSGYPRSKTKHCSRQSYRSQHINGNIKVLDKAVQLPKLGLVRCRVSKQVQGRILSATVSRSPTGKYFVSVCCTDVELNSLPKTGKSIGVDLGIHDLAIINDGTKYANPRHLTKSLKRLARLQRQLSRKTKGSSRRNKARLKVARLHEHVANQRLDMMHKLSTKLVKENDIICVETLNIKEMQKDKHIAPHIADVAWYEFRRQLEYKAKWYGKQVVAVDELYPSTQTCNRCKSIYTKASDLHVRKWTCPTCGTTYDRDINAAINILEEGLRLLV